PPEDVSRDARLQTIEDVAAIVSFAVGDREVVDLRTLEAEGIVLRFDAIAPGVVVHLVHRGELQGAVIRPQVEPSSGARSVEEFDRERALRPEARRRRLA